MGALVDHRYAEQVQPLPPHLRLVWSRPDRPRLASEVFWRRRLVALLLLAIFATGAWSSISSGVGWARQQLDPPVAAASPVAFTTPEEWTVRSGDTLWSIVAAVQPDGDPRPIVQEMSDERGGRALQVGETIAIPDAG